MNFINLDKLRKYLVFLFLILPFLFTGCVSKNIDYQVGNNYGSGFNPLELESKDEPKKEREIDLSADRYFKTCSSKQDIVKVDIDTFTVLNYAFAIDKNNAYWFCRIIKKADPKTFEIFILKKMDTKVYAKDKNNVYHATGGIGNIPEMKIVAGADPASFEFIEDSIFQKDRNYVYCRMNKLEEADVETFEIINIGKGLRFKDKNHIYENCGDCSILENL